MSELRIRSVLITGGGSGMGRAIALALATEGCRVAIAGRQEDKLRQVAAASKSTTPILTHAVDVADRQSVNGLFAWAADKLGPIDVLVNAAGMNTAKRTIADLPPEMWDAVLAVNATGAYNCIYAVLPQMRSRKRGLIINISSVAGKRAGKLGGVAYCASKFAMTALGTAVALEEAANQIRVTNIYPGEVDTPLLEHRPIPVSDEHRARCLRPEDVAEMVVALVKLPAHIHVPELVIKPIWQEYA